MKKAIYIITNDEYSSTPDEVTFDELLKSSKELGWNVDLKEGFGVDLQWPNAYVIYDANAKNEKVVAVEKSAYDS